MESYYLEMMWNLDYVSLTSQHQLNGENPLNMAYSKNNSVYLLNAIFSVNDFSIGWVGFILLTVQFSDSDYAIDVLVFVIIIP